MALAGKPFDARLNECEILQSCDGSHPFVTSPTVVSEIIKRKPEQWHSYFSFGGTERALSEVSQHLNICLYKQHPTKGEFSLILCPVILMIEANFVQEFFMLHGSHAMHLPKYFEARLGNVFVPVVVIGDLPKKEATFLMSTGGNLCNKHSSADPPSPSGVS